MGTTSQKLTYLNETKTLLKNKINITGANITNDTFRQYPTKLQNALLDVWNNEGEPIFTNWGTKVNGEGTNVKLDNTINARMKTTPKGNTTQNGTPTPSSPVPVNVVSGDNEVDIVGKNLLDISNLTTTTNYGLTITNNGDQTITINGTFTGTSTWNYRFPLLKNISGINGKMSVKVISGSYTQPPTHYNPRFELRGSNFNTWVSFENGGGVGDLTSDKTYTTWGLQFLYYSEDTLTFNNLRIGLQVEESSSITEYEPYQSQNYPINFGSLELCKIGTYQDYIYKDSGKWYLHKEVGKVVLDGSSDESINLEANLTNVSRFRFNNIVNAKNQTDTLCNSNVMNTSYGSDTPHYYILSNLTNVYYFIDNSLANSVATFRTWLSNNNVNVYYQLSTPEDTEITNTTLINQLENLRGAMSYEGQTNISSGFMIVGASALGELE